jgi:hypothetical protein
MRTSTRPAGHGHGSRDPRRAERLAVISAKGKGNR